MAIDLISIPSGKIIYGQKKEPTGTGPFITLSRETGCNGHRCGFRPLSKTFRKKGQHWHFVQQRNPRTIPPKNWALDRTVWNTEFPNFRKGQCDGTDVTQRPLSVASISQKRKNNIHGIPSPRIHPVDEAPKKKGPCESICGPCAGGHVSNRKGISPKGLQKSRLG